MNHHVDRAALDPKPLIDDADLAKLLGVQTLSPAQVNYSLAATAMVQHYVDRTLLFDTYTERHFGSHGGALQLLEFPVKSVVSFTAWVNGSATVQDVADYRLMRPSGILLGWWGCELEVVYQAGYETMPADLVTAFMSAFHAIESTSAAGGVGIVKRVAVTDVGSVEFDLGGSGGSEGGGSVASPWGLLPASAVALLAPYRAHGVIGVG